MLSESSAKMMYLPIERATLDLEKRSAKIDDKPGVEFFLFFNNTDNMVEKRPMHLP